MHIDRATELPNINPTNERVKRRYAHYYKEAGGVSDSTVNQALYAIAKFEQWTDFRDFKTFRSDDAVAFRKHLLARSGKKADELSSRATAHGTVSHLRRFFRWLSQESGYRKAMRGSDADFFNLPLRETRIANARIEKPSPTIEQLQHVIRSMSHDTAIEKRDRAIMAILALTGIRVNALISLKLKHVRRDRCGIDQDARQVATKGGRTFTSFFFPVGEDIRDMFTDYVDFLRSTLRLGNEDPLFPRTLQKAALSKSIEVVGLSKVHWKVADPVRRIFATAFAAERLPDYGPHSVRRTLALLGQQLCRTPEEMKAWSQNLGHREVLTTMMSYGQISNQRQAELIAEMKTEGAEAMSDAKLRAIAKMVLEIKGTI